MKAFPSHCPKCGAPPMQVDGARPGHYMCDTFIVATGVPIERAACYQRQRNQAVAALEELSNAATMSDLAFHPANVKARDVINRITGGVLLRTARVFEESDGFHFSCNSLDYLDARGKAHKTKADALRAAFRSGYTHATGSGCYRKGINAISGQVKLDEHDWREHKAFRNPY